MKNKKPSTPPKFHGYEKRLITPESEYKGLDKDSLEWLRNFNRLETNQLKDNPLRPRKKKERKKLGKAQYARRNDAATWAAPIDVIATKPTDPWDSTIELIDSYAKLQRKIKKS